MKLWKVVLLVFTAVLIVVVAYSASVIRHGFSTRTPPSRVEAMVARTVRSWSIPRADKEKPNPWAEAATAEVMADGLAHWANHCATCHANDGSGNTEIGQNLYPPAPDMRLPATQNLTDGELYYIIRNGIRLTGMPAWGDPNTVQDDESWKLVLFIRHLPNLTDAELETMKSMNPKSPQELAEEEAIRRFLEGDDSQPPVPGHNH